MLRGLTFLLLSGVALANICTTNQGSWSFGIEDGVRDFYHTGVSLNKSNNCFEGCLLTGNAVQNFKVKLSGNNGNNSNSAIELTRTKESVMAKLQSNPDDPNADFCVDPVLRQDIANALKKVSSHSCKGVAQTLNANLNRPGWCINCVVFDALSIDGVFQDMNFCDYSALIGNDIYSLRLAAIDFS